MTIYSNDQVVANLAKYDWVWPSYLTPSYGNEWMEWQNRIAYANAGGQGTFPTSLVNEAKAGAARVQARTAATEAANKKKIEDSAVAAYKASPEAAKGVNPSESTLTRAGLDEYYKRKSLLNMRGRGTNNQAQLGGQNPSTIVRTLLGS